jgi:hypothetical protein
MTDCFPHKDDDLAYWKDLDLTFDPGCSSLHCIDFSRNYCQTCIGVSLDGNSNTNYIQNTTRPIGKNTKSENNGSLVGTSAVLPLSVSDEPAGCKTHGSNKETSVVNGVLNMEAQKASQIPAVGTSCDTRKGKVFRYYPTNNMIYH